MQSTGATVLIISEDADFAQPLAEQARSELRLSSQITAHAADALAHAQQAVLAVAHRPIEGLPCPVVVVKEKPLKLAELLARIEEALSKAQEVLALGRRYELHLRAKRLVRVPDGVAVDVTDKEAQLLHGLTQAGKRGCTKEQLLKDVWGIETPLDTHTLETHIYRLRGKFRELGDEDSPIAAIEGGYRLEG